MASVTVSSTGPVVTRYSSVAIGLHWLIALLLLTNIALAWTFQNIPKSLTTFQLIQLHKSTGILVLLLSLARLGWKLTHRQPPYPADLPIWQRLAAQTVQWGFYVVMLGMPLTGWIMVSGSKTNLPTLIYGVVPWPHLPFVHNATGAAKTFWHNVGETHGLLAWLAYALIVLHVGAALMHQFILRDAVLGRMAPWFRRRAA